MYTDPFDDVQFHCGPFQNPFATTSSCLSFHPFTLFPRSFSLSFAALYSTNPAVCLDIISSNTESRLL